MLLWVIGILRYSGYLITPLGTSSYYLIYPIVHEITSTYQLPILYLNGILDIVSASLWR